MPTYDYQCAKCQHLFEAFQGINEPKLVKCPECGKKSLERLIGGGAAIIFKGSGFYSTDYRSDSYKAGANSEKPAECSGTPSNCSVKSCGPAADA